MAHYHDRTHNPGVPDDDVRDQPIMERSEAIAVIRAEHDALAELVACLSQAVADGVSVKPGSREHFEWAVAARARRALLEREAALVTLAGDEYREPSGWDWEELLDAIAEDCEITRLERAYRED
jgi:hypothetical protein